MNDLVLLSIADVTLLSSATDDIGVVALLLLSQLEHRLFDEHNSLDSSKVDPTIYKKIKGPTN